MRTSLTKYFVLAASAALFSAGMLTSAFAGPERIDSKDKVIMAPPECDPRWYISIGGSVDPSWGDFSSGQSESFTAGGFGTDVEVFARDYDDVYSNWWNIKAEIGYAITEHIELFGNFRYTRADGELFTGDVVFVNPPGFAPNYDLDFLSRFSDYESFGGELGARYLFMAKDAKFRPYVAVSGGASWVEGIDLRIDSEELGDNITIYDGAFYDDSIVASITGAVGIQFNVTCHFAVRVEAGLRWESELDQDDSQFLSSPVAAQTNFMSISNHAAFEAAVIDSLSHLNNDGASRLSIPVEVSAVFHF